MPTGPSSAESAEARNPTTPDPRLLELAMDWPELFEDIVLNPSCEDRTREWIFSRSASAKKRYQAVHPPEPEPAPIPQVAPSPQPAPAPRPQKTTTRTPAASGTTTAGTPSSKKEGGCGGCITIIVVVVVVLALVIWGITRMVSSMIEASQDGQETSTAEWVSPAPEDAAEAELIQSPSKNIGCELGDDFAGCSITDRSNKVHKCDDERNANYVVREDEEAGAECDTEFLGSEGDEDKVVTVEYGETVVHGEYACLSEKKGMTCWNQRTGHGFITGKKTYETF